MSPRAHLGTAKLALSLANGHALYLKHGSSPRRLADVHACATTAINHLELALVGRARA